MRVLFLLLLFPLAAAAQDKDSVFHLIAGFSMKTPVRIIYIDYQKEGEYVYDSLLPVGNHFEYKLPLSRRIVGKLSIYGGFIKQDIRILMEPGVMILTAADSLSNFTVVGNKLQKEFAQLERLLQPYHRERNRLFLSMAINERKKDTAGERKAEAELARLDTTMKKDVYRKFIPAHWNSKIALFALGEFASEDFNPYEGERLFNELSSPIRTSPEGEEWRKRIEAAKRIAVGSIAPDFSQPGTNGKSISLRSFRGKYVLLDFWASWCVPCRKENPFLVKAYDKYRKKGFAIFSISLDDSTDHNLWIKAISDDGLKWIHASDLKGWDNEASDLYQVRSIPSNLLIDLEGRIIAKDLRGENLEQKLAEMFK